MAEYSGSGLVYTLGEDTGRIEEVKALGGQALA
jgi:hypothetical protein